MHILLLILFLVILHRIIRRATHPYGYRRPFGYRRHRYGFGGGLFTILGLVALDRLFNGRRW